jgi:hypothetical protein
VAFLAVDFLADDFFAAFLVAILPPPVGMDRRPEWPAGTDERWSEEVQIPLPHPSA